MPYIQEFFHCTGLESVWGTAITKDFKNRTFKYLTHIFLGL